MDYAFTFSRKIKRLYEIPQTAEVMVEADSLEEAREKAKEFAKYDSFSLDWTSSADLNDWEELDHDHEDCLPSDPELVEDLDN
jgi:hypothetical protein